MVLAARFSIYLSNLGALFEAKGDFAATAPLTREALEGRRETLGDRHLDTLASINLGKLLKNKDDLAAAEPLLREVLGMSRATKGSRHPNTLNAISTPSATSASCCMKRVTPRGAGGAAHDARRGRHSTTLTLIHTLDLLLYGKGSLAAAEPLCYVRRCRGVARRSAIGNRTRSPPSACSGCCCL